MVECSSCHKYQFSVREWYCRYCGELRNDCAEEGCTGQIEDRSCNTCGASPEAPCRFCSEWIPADVYECPQCGEDHRKVRENRQKAVNDVGWLSGGGKVSILGVLFGGLLAILGYSVLGIVGLFTVVPIGILIAIGGIVLGMGSAALGKATEKTQDVVYDKTDVKPAGNLSDAKSEFKSEEVKKKESEAFKKAVGSTVSTVENISEIKSEHDRKQKEHGKKQKEEREKQRIQNQRDEISEEYTDAKEKNSTNILWQMNCENCGINWATTQNRKLIRSDDFKTVGFNIINEEEWDYIQDYVRIQCDAPDCNHTDKFTKDSLWSV